MADAKHSPAESSRPGPEDLGKSVYQDTEGVYAHDSLDPIYVAKAKILNDAFREIGMGRYQVCLLWTSVSMRCLRATVLQWYLFIVTGFGWLSYVSLLFTTLCIIFTSRPPGQ